MIRWGLMRGRPRTATRICPCSINSWKTTASWRSPTLKRNVIGRPFPSHRRWILVLNPPTDRPNDSRCWTCWIGERGDSGFNAPFLLRQHVDEPEQYCHPHDESPNWPGRLSLPDVGVLREVVPRGPAVANDRNVLRLFAKPHSA